MKKWIFVLLLFCLIAVSGIAVVYADTWNGEDYGAGTVNEVRFFCDITPGETTSNYDLTVIVSNSKEIIIDALYAVDSSGVKTKYGGASLFTEDFSSSNYRYYADGFVIDNTVDIAYFSISFRHPFDEYTTVFTLNSTMRYEVEPSPTPDPTPEETPAPEPTPEETPTPEPTPEDTPTPEPTPTETPAPTPTNTPTPSPTPAPELYLNAYVDGNKAIAEYRTGGCTPVKSSIEFYEVNVILDTLRKIDGDTFLSGEGNRSDSMNSGITYRYKLTYVYQQSGIQYTEVLWSGDLYISDEELDNYKESGQINNFRTLMLWIWENFFELEISIEGYLVSFKELFVWSMLALLCIWLIREFLFN